LPESAESGLGVVTINVAFNKMNLLIIFRSLFSKLPFFAFA
jgi:hypothetical protein